jgi:hypothetical protein
VPRLAETIVCIELPRHIPIALQEISRQGISDYSIFALTPHVEYELGKLGHSFQRPEDYYLEDDLNTVGRSDLVSLEKFCRAMDEFLQSRLEILRENDLHPGTLDWYYLKTLFNSVSVRAFILRRVMEQELPQRVLYFGTQEEPISTELYYVHESAWSLMIPNVCGALQIFSEAFGHDTDPTELSRCPGRRRGGTKEELKSTLRRILGSKGRSILRSEIAKVRLFRTRLQSMFQAKEQSRRASMLFLERGYSLEGLLQHIDTQDSFDVLYWDVHQSRAPYYLNRNIPYQNGHISDNIDPGFLAAEDGENLWSEVRNLPTFHKYLQFSGIDCFPVIERRLQHFIETDVPRIVKIYNQTISILRDHKFNAVVAATMGTYAHQCVAQAARSEKVPFVVYRHGDSAGHVLMESWPHHIIEQIELRSADYVLGFGQGDVDYLNKSDNICAEIVPIGSGALDSLRRAVPTTTKEQLLSKYGLDPHKKTVIYVPTSMDGNIRITPYRSHSPSRRFALEQRFVETFSEFPDIQFILKLPLHINYPCSPIAQLVQDRQISNCIVITEPFTSLISIADLFITDYASTNFLEMLTTDRPVLLCGYQFPLPWAPGKWHPSVLPMWQERVAYAEDLEEFLDLMRTYLGEERFQAVESDDTLLKLFGTHLDDFKSVERAHDFLESLIEPSSNVVNESVIADPVAG